MVKYCVDILCCSRVQHPQHNNTIKNLYLHQACLLITFLQLKIAALQSKLKLFIHCNDSGVACMYKNIQISAMVLLDKIHKIWKIQDSHFVNATLSCIYVLKGVQLLIMWIWFWKELSYWLLNWNLCSLLLFMILTSITVSVQPVVAQI